MAEDVKLEDFEQLILANITDENVIEGLKYYYGMHGITKDYSKAAELFKVSADNNNPEGELYLGWCYYGGLGVERDRAKAIELYTKSADQGNMNAQYSLGYCYENGQGAEQNYPLAAKYFIMAADQGFRKAKVHLVSRYYKEAFDWYKRESEAGSIKALRHLGTCYFNGDGVEKDLQKASEIYLEAAKLGDLEASQFLLEEKKLRPFSKEFRKAKTLADKPPKDPKPSKEEKARRKAYEKEQIAKEKAYEEEMRKKLQK